MSKLYHSIINHYIEKKSKFRQAINHYKKSKINESIFKIYLNQAVVDDDEAKASCFFNSANLLASV